MAEMCELTQAYNVTTHASTGYSPFYLMFGQEPKLPIDLFLPRPEAETVAGDAETVETWVSLHRKRLEETYRIAKRQTEREADRRKRLYDENARPNLLPNGTLGYLRKRTKGRNKIQDSWHSRIYRVISRQGENHVYVVKPLDGLSEPKTVNRTELKPCNQNDDCFAYPNRESEKSSFSSAKSDRAHISDRIRSRNSSSSDEVEIRIANIEPVSSDSLPASSDSDSEPDPVPRRSSRVNKGLHSNLFNLPRSAMRN